MSGAELKVVCLLLQHGYTQGHNDPKKAEHLLALDGAKERLHLLKADLLEERFFDSVVDGCEGVFHTASPFYYKVTDPQGTLNVLRSCAKVQSIKRVVITSSIVAVAVHGKPFAPDVVIDETWFSNAAVCEKSKVHTSTLFKNITWNDLISICHFCHHQCGSALFPLLRGNLLFANRTYGWVDVRDVDNAQILAFESPSASGRVMHCYKVVKILHVLFPDLNLPKK
ncbi:hypothetical protein ACJW31_10G003000 [Castanea mollissima]